MDRVGRASDGIATNEALLEQLDDALVAYYEALDRGETIDEGAFESTYPQCAAELRAFLARERRLHAQCRDLAHGRTVGRAPPRRLGRFELEQPLGVGGHGAVWRARDVELNRQIGRAHV